MPAPLAKGAINPPPNALNSITLDPLHIPVYDRWKAPRALQYALRSLLGGPSNSD
jgi:hypothetical protein